MKEPITRVFVSETFTCNDSETKVFVDNQNHGGIIELEVSLLDWEKEGSSADWHKKPENRRRMEIEIDMSEIDALIKALQEAKKFAEIEYDNEYKDYV